MNLFPLDALLLFAFAIPVVMKYRILPVEGTPYWLFGILFFVLVINIFVSIYPSLIKKASLILRLKSFFLWTVVSIAVIGVTATAIVDRSKTAPVFGVHDIILQQEAAMRYIIEGKNPYKETYFGTPLESWHYGEAGTDSVNPALYHFVMPPWYLLFPFIFYFISIPIVGYFDGRMVLLFCLCMLLVVLTRWFKNKKLGLVAMTLTALSPAVIDYFIEGRSDVFALSWFVLSLFLLEKRRIFFSSIVFALAILSKQTIWFAVPFYFIYLWKTYAKSPRTITMSVSICVIVLAVLVGPFLLWDPVAFFDSVIGYLSGSTAHSYPISGYGFSMMLYAFGFIKNLHASYPAWIFQGLFGLPSVALALRFVYQKPLMSRLILGYALSLTVIWYFSRYFNNSHLGYLSSVYVLGILKDLDEKESA